MLIKPMLAATAALALTASAAGAAPQPAAQARAPQAAAASAANLSYEQHVSCAAIFFVFSKMQTDAESTSALEAATGVMLNRAIALPAARNLNEDQVVEAAVTESMRLEERISAQTTQAAKTNVVHNWGPGLALCLEAVLQDV